MIDPGSVRTRGVALVASRLCLLGNDPCGGSEVVLWEDARILQSAGIPVRVYARAARRGAPVETVRLRSRTARLNTIEYSRAVLQNESGSLVFAYNEPAFAGFAPDRTIARFDWATPLPRYWNWPMWRSRFARARYLFPSESERSIFLQQHVQIPRPQTIVIANGVDLELFGPQNRAHAKVPIGGLKVGFAGQWTERKGIKQLLEAWRVLKPSLPDCELDIAGGPHVWRTVSPARDGEQLAERVRQMQSDHLLHCTGPLPRKEMPNFWNSVDVAVVPSLYEPFGLVAVEALACGVPVIAAATGGLKEIVLDGECGLLVPPGDPVALVRALRLLLTDDQLRLRLAAGACPRAKKFSLQDRSRHLLALVRERTERAA